MGRRGAGFVIGIYIVGGVIDAVAALALALPAGSPIRTLVYPGVGASQVAYADGTRTAFPLMLGWTLLLAWGAFRPLERRALLLMTVPVVVGFMAIEVLDAQDGYASLTSSLPTLALQTVLVAWLVGAWAVAGSLARRRSTGSTPTD